MKKQYWVTFIFLGVISFTFLCVLRSAACVTSGAELWRKPKMTSENRLILSLLSLRAHLWPLGPVCLFAHLNHPVMSTRRVSVCVRRWAHVVCAVALPEVRFSDEAKRSPIDTSRVPMQRYKLVSGHTHARTHIHRHTCAHTDAGLELPRSLRSSSL